ncbi:hypothetical protein COP2_042684 [Malus domestica]
MLHDKSMPYFLWAEAIHTAVYILNRSPTKALNNLTPFKAYNGRKPGVGHLKVFGSVCYVHVPSETRQKLDAKSVKGVFVGYTTCEKGYRVLDPCTKKLILSRDVVFDETMTWTWKESSEKDVAVTYIQNHSEDQTTMNANELREAEESPSDSSPLFYVEEPECSTHESVQISQSFDHTLVK